MFNWIKDKISNYSRNKAITQINADPIGVARRVFSPVVNILSVIFGQVKDLYWIGSFEYNLDMIEYYKKQDNFNNINLIENYFKRNTDDENIIDVFIGKGSGDVWFLAFFLNPLDLNKHMQILDSFKVNLENVDKLQNKKFTKIY